jgi:hypothetical protein
MKTITVRVEDDLHKCIVKKIAKEALENENYGSKGRLINISSYLKDLIVKDLKSIV